MEISYQRVTSLLQQREGGDLEYLEYDWDDDGIRIPPADRCRYDINDMYDTRENDADSNDDLEDDTTMGNSDRVASAAAPTTTTKSATSSRMGKHPHHRSSKNYINNYIAVIPSLVSLAEDFFLCDDVSPPAAVAAATTFYASGARAGGNRGMTSMTLSEEDSESGEMMFPQEEGGVQDIIMMERNEHHGHHHRHREHPPPSLTTTLRPRPAANNNIDDLDITLGHHTSRYNYGFLNDNTYDDDPPPEDWPVGPQGAPIPSHLLLRQYHHNRSPSMEESTSRRRRHRRRRRHYDYHDGISFHEEGEEDEMGEPNSRVDDVLSNTALDQQSPSLFASAASSASSTAAASDVSTNARESMLNDGNHAQPSSLPLLQQLPPSPSVPPPPSLLSPPSPPFGLRRRQHQPRSNDTLHNNTTTTNSGGWGWREQRRFQNQTVLSTPPPSAVNINAVKFLDHAVTRLENKLSTQSTTSSSSNIDPISATSTQQQQQQYNIEELESNLLTQLVEIMLNPPTTTTVTAKQTTTNLMEDDSTNACDNNEHVCSSREDDDDEESSGSDKHHDDDDFDIDDDDGEEEEEEEEEDDTMTITGASSGETSNSDTKTRPPILFKSCSSTSSSTPAIMTPFSKQHGTKYPTIASAKLAIQQLGQMVPQRRVCQYAFKRNDIVWVCRTCQSDETCVLCHECFRNSNHEGHDVAFYHAQAGGCCDCGDEDAWSPKGFCGRHGGPSSTTTSKNDNEVEVEKEENPTMTMLTKIEPAVLGAVRAIADYLAVVVRSGVEAGYRRANPASAFHASTTSASALGADNINDDTLLPEYYDEHDGGRDRRHQREFRRYHSLHRRNTVADMETAPDTSLPMLHEAQFIPSLASTSASASQRWTSNPSASEAEEIDMPTGNRVFDPNAAGSSSSYSSSPKFTSASNHCAAKMECGNTSDLEPDNPTRDKAPPGRSPARALGDLGREEHGLFLVLHCDDIHMGHPPSSSSHQSSSYNRSEVIAALKELYSAPGGGGGKVGDAIAGVSSGVHHIPDMWGGGGGGGAHVFGTTNRFTRQPDRLLLSPSRYSLFRAPQAEAILDRIVQIVKMQGDLIVWGTQEILAECGKWM
jgi:hypothetical protein